MFLVLALLLFLVLPDPWDVVGGITCTALFVVEVGFWQRRVRGQKAQTGVQRLVGATGEVSGGVGASPQVRVLGELWEARSSTELAVGERVRVVAVDGLTLEVEPAEPPS